MSGRGDNNKNGSSGRGASNQSGEGMAPHSEKMNHGKQTGGQPSKPQTSTRDKDSNRNSSTDRETK